MKTPVESSDIAVVGMACTYPGAEDLRALWENVLARRRQFRRIPDVRLPLDVYHDPDPATPDKTYGTRAAVIDGFDFDWVGWRIPKSTFESTDIAHWLALSVAARALTHAGYDRQSVPTHRTGVIVGNSLTGEQTRAQTMRLRWPFVQRVLEAAAAEKGLSAPQVRQLAQTMEGYYKSVFAPITEDTLAGGLSNTIAGRVANAFDLNGGGYTVDGACSSSLLAVATAANNLVSGDLDLALAGGVDISLDTFELIGFAKTGALTEDDMRVYDRRAKGFIPGEGCGFVLLKRLADARRDGNYVYAVLQGWGVSSDGKGGITAPNGAMQAEALSRAYQRASYPAATLDFVEGHGTGTTVGDREELSGIALALGDQAGSKDLRACGVTSLKSIIGHAKAAAGIGGFIKAALAVNQRVIPPTAGCEEPNPLFETQAHALYPVLQGEVRPATDTLRAGVSAMGFGGINCHVTLTSGDAPADLLPGDLTPEALLATAQSTEVFVLAASTWTGLQDRIAEVMRLSEGLSEAERVDLAAHLGNTLDAEAPCRAAVVADRVEQLQQRLHALADRAAVHPLQPGDVYHPPGGGIYLGYATKAPRIGFLFPGQGAQQLNMTRPLVQRHPWAAEALDLASDVFAACAPEQPNFEALLHRPVDRARDEAQVRTWHQALTQTEVAQPAICLASALWHRQLSALGISPVAVGGHSLGELTAFYAAGAFDLETLIRLAAYRGRAMRADDQHPGTMASLGCDARQAAALIDGVDGVITIANYNSPNQTVISGAVDAVETAVARAEQAGLQARMLRVSNAFHSALVSDAAQRLSAQAPVPETLPALSVPVVSGVTGKPVEAGLNLRTYFGEQIASPVHFMELAQHMASACDVLIEVGPGRILSTLMPDIPGAVPCLPVAGKPGRDQDLNFLLATLFVHGQQIAWPALYAGRLVRPFVPAAARTFIMNPCERPLHPGPNAPSGDGAEAPASLASALEHVLDLPKPELDNYLQHRGGFLQAVIQADLAALPVSPASKPAPVVHRHEELAQPEKAVAESSLALLYRLVEARTGFPVDTLSPEMKLLDDLNLDSIKGAELIAEAAREVGGTLDPMTLSTAALETIADALDALAPGAPDATPQAPLTQEGLEALLLAMIAERTGFPAATLSPEMKLLDDLNLDSIKGAELIAEAAREVGVAGSLDPSTLATRSIAQVAEALFALMSEAPAVQETASKKAKELPWVREFEMVSVATPLTGTGAVPWQGQRVLLWPANGSSPLSASLTKQLHAAGATVIDQSNVGDQDFSTVDGILCMVPDRDVLVSWTAFSDWVSQIQPLAALAKPDVWIGYVQNGTGRLKAVVRGSAMALAASQHLEHPNQRIRVIELEPGLEPAQEAEHVLAECSTAAPFSIAGYSAESERFTRHPVVHPTSTDRPRAIAWAAEDVILVTGGAKGITAACALALAQQTGVQMALVGRTAWPPAKEDAASKEIGQTLHAFEAAGCAARYYACDLTDAGAVEALIETVDLEMGPVTGVIHGAALNQPRRLEGVSPQEALREMAPKLAGAIHLCAALNRRPLKLFAGLTSIIGLTGMAGSGWYGCANEHLNRLLHGFKRQHPETAVLTLAYSIWDTLGMGARMGAVAHLNRLGIDALPVEEGVRRFVHRVLHDAGTQQTVIAARLGGIDTWQPQPHPLPRARRFLERITTNSPDVELVARATLSTEKDPYLRDHNWRGALLFPTVFGLEAMAQAVAALTGETNFTGLSIEDIRLERPIVVPEEGELEIELRALAHEQTPETPSKTVTVHIATAQTGFEIPHFSARFVWQVPPVPEADLEGFASAPLDLDPARDLYGGLLFQGPAFHRLRRIYTLEAEGDQRGVCQYTAQSEETDFLLGDPYLRDALLQSVQLIVPQEICLPIHIHRLTCYAGPGVGARRAVTRLLRREGDAFISTVVLCDEAGQVVEALDGYRLRILEHQPENPTVSDLCHPEAYDQKRLGQALDKHTAALRIDAPACRVWHVPAHSSLDKPDRHTQQGALLGPWINESLGRTNGQALASVLRWDAAGKPGLDGPAAPYSLSLAHKHDVLLCTLGEGVQGCDLERVAPRTKSGWLDLLGASRGTLLDERQAAGDNLDRAGTRIWAAVEAAWKAQNEATLDLHLDRSAGEAVLFRVPQLPEEVRILTFPIRLARGPEQMVAVVVISQSSRLEVEEPGTVVAQGTRRHVYPMPVTFSKARSLGGRLPFSAYAYGLGEVREYPLQPIMADLVAAFGTGKWGMVSNNIETHIWAPVSMNDALEAHLQFERISGETQGTYAFTCDWKTRLPDGTLRRVASSTMQTTWVEVLGHGRVRPAPPPPAVQAFFKQLEDEAARQNQEGEGEVMLDVGQPLFTADDGPLARPLLHTRTIETGLEDANLVGNIYFAQYAGWMARTENAYFQRLLPAVYRSNGKAGAFFCTHYRIQHLREAMPFDEVVVEMRLDRATTCGLLLAFDFFRLENDGGRSKLATGTQNLVWMQENTAGQDEVHPLPEALLEHLPTLALQP